MTKRISQVHKQVKTIKQLVSKKQQAEINLRTNFDHIDD